MAFNDNKPRTHTYANAGNVLQLKGVSRLYPCDYQPAFNVVVAAGGATATVTPIDGHLVAGLLYWNINIYDGVGGEAIAGINTASPATPFVVNTAGLDVSESWVLQFSGAKQGNADSVACREDFQLGISTGEIAAGATIQVRLEPYTFFKADISRAITDARINGGADTAIAVDDAASVQAGLEAALDAAGIAYETITVIDGAVGTFSVTATGIVDKTVVIELKDSGAAYQALVLQ